MNAPKPVDFDAVVLAAGAAARLGQRPKCLLEYEGQPLLLRTVHALRAAGIDKIVVVLGHYAEQIAPLLADLPVRIVHNPMPDAGQNSSLHCGLRALENRNRAVLVALADQPLIEAKNISDLISAYRQRPQHTEVLVPTCDNLPGNPVLFSAVVRDEILQHSENFGCKQWQRDNPQRVYRWSTPHINYRIDIDTPDDIENFFQHTGKALHWPRSN